MELEDWIKQDIRHFIERHQPLEIKVQHVRDEEQQSLHVNYEQKIHRALTENRLDRAQDAFSELKNVYFTIPLSHQQERKKYFHIIQKSYRDIYQYVMQQHQTARILSSLPIQSDVFSAESLSFPLPDAPNIQPIEEAMIRSEKLPNSPPSQPVGNKLSTHDQIQEWKPPTFSYEKKTRVKKTSGENKVNRKKIPPRTTSLSSHVKLPEWKPPAFDFSHKSLPKQIISHSKKASKKSSPVPLVEVKKPLIQPVNTSLGEPREFFSKAYLQGIHAMQTGNYKKAAFFFQKRIQQTPYDRAALIRLKECMEAIHA